MISGYCAFEYQKNLSKNIQFAQQKIISDADDFVEIISARLSSQEEIAKAIKVAIDAHSLTDEMVLEQARQHQIPDLEILMILYLGVFVSAGSAFILMAIREYLQDLVGLEEIDLIVGPATAETGVAKLEKSP